MKHCDGFAKISCCQLVGKLNGLLSHRSYGQLGRCVCGWGRLTAIIYSHTPTDNSNMCMLSESFGFHGSIHWTIGRFDAIKYRRASIIHSECECECGCVGVCWYSISISYLYMRKMYILKWHSYNYFCFGTETVTHCSVCPAILQSVIILLCRGRNDTKYVKNVYRTYTLSRALSIPSSVSIIHLDNRLWYTGYTQTTLTGWFINTHEVTDPFHRVQ